MLMPTPTKGYFNAAGKRVPGTTTIIGRFKNATPLMWWANSEGLEGRKLYEKRDQAAEIGTVAHNMVEMHINGETRTHIKEYLYSHGLSNSMEEGAWNAYRQFVEWSKQTNIEFITKYQEVQLVSESYQFGGTPDAIGIINGKRCLLDWKTSNGIYSDYLVQVAAYKLLWEENNPDEPIDGGVHIARFSKEYADYEHRYFGDVTEGLKLFTLYREAYEIDKRLNKRV
jgi:hypothetical protein